MKYFVLIILLTQVLHAKWRPLTLKELIKSSDAIVMASYLDGKDTVQKKHSTKQINRFKLIDTIKGNIKPEFLVRGRKTRMCVPQTYFENSKQHKFLLFLGKKYKGSRSILNGQFGALKIESNKVPWFIENKEYSFQRKPKDLKLVLKEIQSNLVPVK
ncbi:MAG: hypothetical protein KC646_08360 [Candidatus Cloacimonetes bacterium]|nr:hypothetical protein [Candidatus Cloacimonadota bacterium]